MRSAYQANSLKNAQPSSVALSVDGIAASAFSPAWEPPDQACPSQYDSTATALAIVGGSAVFGVIFYFAMMAAIGR